MAEEIQSPTIRRTESGYRFELSGLRSAVADALIMIGHSSTLDNYNANINAAMSAMDTLEDHLAAYLDDKYLSERDGKYDKKTQKRDGSGFANVHIMTVEEYSKLNPKLAEEDPDTIERKVEELRLDTLRKQLRERYQALMRLQDRKNLLLEEETEDYAGD